MFIIRKKLFELGDGKILLIKQNNTFKALGTKCSHYGGPLLNGVLYGGHISCPWHGACFNLDNGDIEDFPGCDSIPSYQVTVKGSDVIVKANKIELINNVRVKPLSARNAKNATTFVVVGGGASGFECAETLRQEGFDGRVVMITNEDSYPYDRTKLSKSLNTKVEDLLLRSKEYLNKANIEVILNTSVNKLDTTAHIVHLDNGSNLKYDKIFLGTGLSPKKLEVPGSTLKNICYLKTHKDANYIAEMATNKNVAIIGTSFIGMEVASFLNGKAKSIALIGRSKFPFTHNLGEKIGEQMRKLYESKGIKFYTDCEVKEFHGVNNELKELLLTTKEVISADLCVVGIGSDINIDYLKNTDIHLDKHYVLVNNHFETSIKNVYAGGDIVRYPVSVLDNVIVNVGHWQTAQSHGKIAALNMLGKSYNYKSVPFFWAMMLGKGVRFSGHFIYIIFILL